MRRNTRLLAIYKSAGRINSASAFLAWGFHFDGADGSTTLIEVNGGTVNRVVSGGVGPHVSASRAVYGSGGLYGLGDTDSGYVQLNPLQTSYDQLTDSWAFIAQVKFDALAGCILSGTTFYFTGVSGYLYFGDGFTNPIAAAFGAIGITTGVNYEIALCYDATTTTSRLYVNGVLKATGGPVNAATHTATNIGSGTGGNFQGSIDDAQFYVGTPVYTGGTYTPQSGPF